MTHSFSSVPVPTTTCAWLCAIEQYVTQLAVRNQAVHRCLGLSEIASTKLPLIRQVAHFQAVAQIRRNILEKGEGPIWRMFVAKGIEYEIVFVRKESPSPGVHVSVAIFNALYLSEALHTRRTSKG
jgi:hypothetical protein